MTDARLGQEELDALWDFDRPYASEQRFREAENTVGRTETSRAELTTQRARALGLQERYDEADELLDSIPELGPLVAARVALERGRLQRSSGDPAAAVPYFLAALDAAREAGSPFLATDALHMLVLADPTAADHWTRLALVELRDVEDRRTQQWQVALHNNLGWHHLDAEHPAAALEEFAAALVAAREYGTSDQSFAGEWAVAHCLRTLGRPEEARAILIRLATERPDDPQVAAEIAALTDAAPTIEE